MSYCYLMWSKLVSTKVLDGEECEEVVEEKENESDC